MHNYSHFTGEQDGYTVDLKLGGYYPWWAIIKDGVVITEAQYHHPVTSSGNSELAAKAHLEKFVNQLALSDPIKNNPSSFSGSID